MNPYSMSILQMYLYYFIINFFMEFAIFFVILSFLDYPIFWKKIVVLAGILDVLDVLPVATLAILANGRIYLIFLSELLLLVLNLAAVCFVFEKDRRKAVIVGLMGYACYYQVYEGCYCLVSITGSILSVAICAFFCYWLGRLLRKLRVSESLAYFMKDKRQQNILMVLGMLLCNVQYIPLILSQFQWFSDFVELFAYKMWQFSAVFFAVLLYITFYARHKQKEEAQETLLMQQQMYIESLEDLGREVRMYRHDYKNMLSGLMLSASEGDMKKIQEFLQESAGNFEEAVGKRILQTTQIANLRQTELKSLVLTKMVQMQRLGIPCHFEALEPVESVHMHPLDLNRCVGILLDNAIEETIQHPNGEVGLIFTSQNGILTILVENTLGENIDIPRMFQEGYSTKGTKRGVGLASYAHIVEKYKNVDSITRIREQKLIQELKIS